MKTSNVMLALLLTAMIVVPAVAIADVDYSMADDSEDAGDDEKQDTSPWFLILIGILFVVAIIVPFYMRYKDDK